ncbi:MAG TPA: hypothetical protein VHO69_09285, partial [Phototrophicaceae bacterium]|nr:hypothetical protein [Phototrophicaceae bacterium]
MKSRSVILMIALLLALLVGSVAAQDSGETYTFSSGDQFAHPESWQVNDRQDFVTLDTSFGEIYMQDSDQLDFLGIDPEAALNTILREYHSVLQDTSAVLNRRGVTKLTIDDREALQYRYKTAAGQFGLVLAIRFSNDRAGIIDVVADAL